MKLLLREGADVNEKDMWGSTALINAAEIGDKSNVTD